MPRQGNYTEQQAKAMLEDYIHPGECDADVFPTDLDPRVVSDFIRDEVQPSDDEFSMGRAVMTARFYTLRDRVGQFEGFLQPKEKDRDALVKTCSLITTLAELGTPAQQRRAVEEFDRVLPERVAEQGLDLLIRTFFSLPPRTNQKPLRERAAQARVNCERNGPEEKLGDFMDYDIRLLPAMTTEKSRRDGILNLPRGPERLQRWAEAYLGLAHKTVFVWDKQAGFGLLADARDEGDEAAVTALTAVMGKLDAKVQGAEFNSFAMTRGYRARVYFLEQLEEEQREDRDRHERTQQDLIQ